MFTLLPLIEASWHPPIAVAISASAVFLCIVAPKTLRSLHNTNGSCLFFFIHMSSLLKGPSSTKHWNSVLSELQMTTVMQTVDLSHLVIIKGAVFFPEADQRCFSLSTTISKLFWNVEEKEFTMWQELGILTYLDLDICQFWHMHIRPMFLKVTWLLKNCLASNHQNHFFPWTTMSNQLKVTQLWIIIPKTLDSNLVQRQVGMLVQTTEAM